MMQKSSRRFLSVSILLSFSFSLAQYQVQQVVERQIGPGIHYFQVIEKIQPWSIHIMEVDLTNPYLELESSKGYEVLTQPGASTLERTTSMVVRSSSNGHRVVGAINADFWETTGEPCNIQIVKGQVVLSPIHRSTFGFTPKNKPVMNRVQLNAWAIGKNASYSIDKINAKREVDFLVLYNHFYGSSTKTDSYGTEVLLRPLNTWMVNDTVMCIVDSVVQGVGNMSIPDDEVVLSGNQNAASFIDQNMHSGDTLQLYIGLKGIKEKVKELLGGMPQIVHQGKICVDASVQIEDGAKIAYVRHPRTAAGFTQDSTRLYLVVVDGRQPALSNGMTMPELAEYMISLGCQEALNLDGGGSSTMVIRDKIVNSPSDGRERPVANALLVISSAANQPANHLEIMPRSIRILEDQSISFSVAALDTFFNIIDTTPNHFRFTADSGLGFVTDAGVFTAGSSRDSGYVRFRYQNIVDSAYVVLKTLEKLTISPKKLTIETTQNSTFKTLAIDSDGSETRPVYSWTSTNTQVGSINATGEFHANHPGKTAVVVEACGLADTAYVKVVVARDALLLEGGEDDQLADQR